MRAVPIRLVCYAFAVILTLNGCGAGTGLDPEQANNPAPVLDRVSPSMVLAGSGPVEIAAIGSRFVEGAYVTVGSIAIRAEFVNEGELRFELPAQQSERVGTTVAVLVRNPDPSDGASSPSEIEIVATIPGPAIQRFEPPVIIVGSADTDVHVFGEGFNAESIVRVDGEDQATSLEAEGSLKITLPASRLLVAKDFAVGVFNLRDNAGSSAEKTFQVRGPYPVPVLTELLPPTVSVPPAGVIYAMTSVRGSNFTAESEVLVDGREVVSTFFSESELRAILPLDQVTDGGTRQISVRNPAPGGGNSGELTLTVENPVPQIDELDPPSFPAGSAGGVLTITGDAFVPSSQVEWNGVARTVQENSTSSLQIQVSAADVQTIGQAAIRVINPGPGGGEDRATVQVFAETRIPLVVNSVIFDAPRGRLLATIPSTQGPTGNSVAAIDPTTGSILNTVFVGSEPTVMALSGDGTKMYVGLDGSPQVVPYDLATDLPGTPFTLRQDPTSPTSFTEDIVVMPGSNDTVVVASYRRGVSPRDGSVDVYRAGTLLPNGTSHTNDSNRIEAIDSATIVGLSRSSDLWHYAVSPTGLVDTDLRRNVLDGIHTDITVRGTRIYATNGSVLDAQSFALLGTFDGRGPLAVTADGATVFFAESTEAFPVRPTGIRVFDASTFIPTGSLRLSDAPTPLQIIILPGGVVVVRSAVDLRLYESPIFGS